MLIKVGDFVEVIDHCGCQATVFSLIGYTYRPALGERGIVSAVITKEIDSTFCSKVTGTQLLARLQDFPSNGFMPASWLRVIPPEKLKPNPIKESIDCGPQPSHNLETV